MRLGAMGQGLGRGLVTVRGTKNKYFAPASAGRGILGSGECSNDDWREDEPPGGVLMKRFGMILGLVLAVVLPLAQIHCACSALGTEAAASAASERSSADTHQAGHHASTPEDAPESDPCCASCLQLLTILVPAPVWIVPPSSSSVLLATMPPTIAPERTPDAPEPGGVAQPHSKSPPHPATSSQSPRSPPLSA